jgi:putative FmdB family regulatory protein
MPTYEYKCGGCGHHFEVFQNMTADPVKVCPECGKRKVKRLIGAGSGFIMKKSHASKPCPAADFCCGHDTHCGKGHCE